METVTGIDVRRRALLRTVAAGAAVVAVPTVATPVAAQSTDLTTWFANTDNADSVADRTGQDAVTVRVGTEANGASFGFGPAAVRVDPGTTVTWEWTGAGNQHNVVADDGSYESDLKGDGVFESTFESVGASRYVCTPHESVGMKGAVIVGDGDVTLGGSGSTTQTGTVSEAENGDGDENLDASAVTVDYNDWFDDVSNYDGTKDATGQEEVRIDVGAAGNGDNFAFDPPAVHVDPGTTIVWEWTGEGGQHNVVGNEDSFESDLTGDAGTTYGIEVDGNGIVKYAGTPHEAAGMKGAIVVGSPGGRGGIDWLKTGLVGLGAGIVAAPFLAGEVLARRHRDDKTKF
jgi:halocyanin-like protein